MRGDSLISFLRDLRTRRFAYKTDYFKNINTDFASDFDVYSALCESISLFAGHQIREAFLTILSNECSEEVKPLALCNFQYRKGLWEKVFYEEPQKPINAENSLFISSVLKEKSLLLLESVDIRGLVPSAFENIFDALEDALLQLSAKKTGVISFDARGMKYTRPNDFLAQESYDALKRCGADDGVFFLWLSCRILMKTKLKLRVIVDSADFAERIIKLLTVLKLRTELYLSFSVLADGEYEKYADLLLRNHKKNISLEPYISKEMGIEALSGYLENIIKILPLACMKISYDVADILCASLDTALEGKVDSAEKAIIINLLKRVE